MQSLHRDVDLYVHRIIHESLMKELNQEYHSLYGLGQHNEIYLKSKGLVVANYRDFETNWVQYNAIFGCAVNSNSVRRRQDNKNPIKVPNRYRFSSGMDSRTGYLGTINYAEYFFHRV